MPVLTPVFRHGKNTTIIIGTSDLSNQLRSAASNQDADTADTTAFESLQKTYVVGIPGGKMDFDGMFSGGTGEVDDFFSSILGQEADVNVSVFPESCIVGRNSRTCQALESAYDISSPVADMVSIKANIVADGGIAQGYVLQARTPLAAGVTTGAEVDTLAAPTTLGGFGMLHVIANTAVGTTTVVLQDAAISGGPYVAITGGTFTVVPGVTKTSQRLVIPTTTSIRRYIRVVTTVAAGAGSVTPVVSLAKRYF